MISDDDANGDDDEDDDDDANDDDYDADDENYDDDDQVLAVRRKGSGFNFFTGVMAPNPD